ncbi:MAG: L-threonylcarbamoyladenylate synthase [Bacillota bacterium]|nr:L-threonylcarbamoyladenylate synthase [Bacillota bacterium]
MNTEIIRIDKNNINVDKIKAAADILRVGRLVAFPTETVYGLGANALDEEAVKKIFAAKGRPSDNPLIVHVSDKEMIEGLVKKIPEKAFELMRQFWPGALTLIMEKADCIPHIITGGLNTVAIRMPSHPIALELIKVSQIPVAAPSANISGRPSPTEAEHVIHDLSGKVDLIIDGGSSNIGLESTVLDLTVDPPMVLRPGGVTLEQLRGLLKDVVVDPALLDITRSEFRPKAPGMKYTHYSPKADVIIVDGNIEAIVSKINELASNRISNGIKVGILATEQTREKYKSCNVLSLGDRRKPETIAANLFKGLRELDLTGVEVIFTEAVDDTGVGLAIMNRMKKAAGFNIIKV